MLAIKKILFPTDFSEYAERALVHVAQFVVSHEAELHILHVGRKDGDHAKSAEDSFSHQIDVLQEKIKGLFGITTPQPQIYTHVITMRESATAIVNYAEENEVDMIILSTHGRSGIMRFFLGSVAEEIVLNSRCAVLTVREPPNLSEGFQIKNILIPVDFSRYSQKAIEHARELSEFFKSNLHITNIIKEEPSSSVFVTGRRSLFELAEERGRRARASLEQLRDVSKCEGANLHTPSGVHVPDEIEKLSKELKIDLIVLASHGTTGRKTDGLGSTAQALISHVNCPILTLRCFGRSLLSEKTLD